MKLGDILRGCVPGRLQLVGNMAVLPLISDLQFLDYTSPEGIKSDGGVTKRTTQTATAGAAGHTYGTMMFVNGDPDRMLIIPSHTGYIDATGGQDHTMCTCGLVGKNTRKRFHKAACIEQTQSGDHHLGDRKMTILPWQLRIRATQARNLPTGSYNKLWDDIGKLNKKAGLPSAEGHLNKFFNKYNDQLANFIAEFEPVHGQVGAVIFVDGAIVGIERVPNRRYWMDIWPALIRDCYGSLAITSGNSHQPKIHQKMNLSRVYTFEDLEAEFRRVDHAEGAAANDLIRDFQDEEFTTDNDDSSGDTVAMTIKSHGDRYVGQVVQVEGAPIVYASIVTSETYAKHSSWHDSKKFSV